MATEQTHKLITVTAKAAEKAVHVYFKSRTHQAFNIVNVCTFQVILTIAVD